MNGSLRGTGSTENHPRWGGADGRGTEHPPPLSPAALVERFSLITPTTRRFQRLLPPPGRGRAVYGDRPGWPCTGSVSETIRRDTSPDTVSMENHPCLDVSPGTVFADHPPPPGRYRGLHPPPLWDKRIRPRSLSLSPSPPKEHESNKESGKEHQSVATPVSGDWPKKPQTEQIRKKRAIR